MKAGSSLQHVAERVAEQARSVRDFLAPMNHIRVDLGNGSPQLVLDDGTGAMPFSIAETTHEQIAEALTIPLPYYRRLREEAPDLLASNVNTWLGRGSGCRLVRTIRASAGGSTARAFLSDRYRPLDNAALLEAMLPELSRAGAEIVSCELTERRLFVKAVMARIAGEVRVGEAVQAGIVLSNSEIGFGSVSIQPLVMTLRCARIGEVCHG